MCQKVCSEPAKVSHSVSPNSTMEKARYGRTVGLPIHVLLTATPGASISTTGPKLENEARRSLMSTAPIVLTAGTRAGLVF
jgi:hypothetical protein